MTKHEKEVYQHIKRLAEDQVLFLKNRYRMPADEIIQLYTGKRMSTATYAEAVESITEFNLRTAAKNGFVAG